MNIPEKEQLTNPMYITHTAWIQILKPLGNPEKVTQLLYGPLSSSIKRIITLPTSECRTGLIKHSKFAILFKNCKVQGLLRWLDRERA